ncbi:MAG: sigma-70 family RNA polymerase sigma factor [Acidobacteria bacterium]|nr:sigma-70 family RNA polymerase sigma factor [Acidobacteriota bacterium]
MPGLSRRSQITQLLTAWSNGDEAALETLTPLVERELHKLAIGYMAGERPDNVLQATALVNEAYLRLVAWKDARWQNRAHFFAMAATIMRRILVDEARRQQRARRGGRPVRVPLSEIRNLASPQPSADVIALDDALAALETLDRRKSRVIELRFFGGLSLEEAAHVLGVSVATVRRDWSLARAWLSRELSRSESAGDDKA